MADFWDLSASDLAGGVLAYQTAKAASKPAADARLTGTYDGMAIDGQTGTDAVSVGLPKWVVFAGLGLAVGFLIFSKGL